jgi:hypothetical protein
LPIRELRQTIALVINHSGRAVLLVVLVSAVVFGCQKKEEAAPAPSASPPPPAVSVAPIKEPEPPAPVAAAAPSGAPAESAAPAAPAPSASAAAAEPKKFVPGGDLTACCNAIAAAAKTPGKAQNRYAAASAVCSGLAKAVKTGKANFASAKVTLHAQLAGVPVPSGC